MPTCDICKVEAVQCLSCGGCRGRQYCSKECHLADWKKKHKKECATLPKGLRQCRITYGKTDKYTKNNEEPGFNVISEELSSILVNNLIMTSSTFIQFHAFVSAATMLPKLIIGNGLIHVSAIMDRIKTDNKYLVYKPQSDYVDKIASSHGCNPIWLSGPDKRNNYLGLSSIRGIPIKQSLNQWYLEYTSAIKNTLSKKSNPESINQDTSLMRLLFDTGSFDKDKMCI
jgi:hypothetical protein